MNTPCRSGILRPANSRALTATAYRLCPRTGLRSTQQARRVVQEAKGRDSFILSTLVDQELRRVLVAELLGKHFQHTARLRGPVKRVQRGPVARRGGLVLEEVRRPGNVGGDQALAEVYRILSATAGER